MVSFPIFTGKLGECVKYFPVGCFWEDFICGMQSWLEAGWEGSLEGAWKCPGSLPSLLFPDTLAQVLEGQPWVMGLTERLARAACFPNSKLSLKAVPGLLGCPLARPGQGCSSGAPAAVPPSPACPSLFISPLLPKGRAVGASGSWSSAAPAPHGALTGDGSGTALAERPRGAGNAPGMLLRG